MYPKPCQCTWYSVTVKLHNFNEIGHFWNYWYSGIIWLLLCGLLDGSLVWSNSFTLWVYWTKETSWYKTDSKMTKLAKASKRFLMTASTVSRSASAGCQGRSPENQKWSIIWATTTAATSPDTFFLMLQKEAHLIIGGHRDGTQGARDPKLT